MPLFTFVAVFLVLWFFFAVLKIRSVKQFKKIISGQSHNGEKIKDFFNILDTHSIFYKNLSPEGKKIFISRCIMFIDKTDFLGMEGLEVTTEMQLRIAATAVQVSFGLDSSAFSHFRVVKIYPETFYSRMVGNYLKGGASASGTLFFSWKDFEHGFADPSDRYNLGLHEMAHALRVQLRHGGDFDRRFASYADGWVEAAMPEFERMNEGKTSFLREYGGTNIEEFFAVCIEHFFEVPFEFQKQLPDIYNHLCFLLNLDPTRTEDDYRLKPGFVESVNSDTSRLPLPLKLKPAYHYESWHWSYNYVIAGLFAGTPLIFIMHGKVLFSGMQIFLFFITITAVGMFFRKFLLDKGLGMFHHVLLFCVAGAAPLLTSAFLVSNYFIPVSYSAKAYEIKFIQSFTKREGEFENKYYLLTLKHNALKNYAAVRTVPAGMIRGYDYSYPIHLGVTTSKGIWGLENFEDKVIIAPNRVKNAVKH